MLTMKAYSSRSLLHSHPYIFTFTPHFCFRPKSRLPSHPHLQHYNNIFSFTILIHRFSTFLFFDQIQVYRRCFIQCRGRGGGAPLKIGFFLRYILCVCPPGEENLDKILPEIVKHLPPEEKIWIKYEITYFSF
jgi:hypothetical protein